MAFMSYGNQAIKEGTPLTRSTRTISHFNGPMYGTLSKAIISAALTSIIPRNLQTTILSKNLNSLKRSLVA